MKKYIFIITILLLAFSLSAQIVNGELLTVEGKKVLKIWGTHYERGYAHGYLLGDEIKELTDEFFVNYIFSGNAVMYEFVRNYFVTHFSIDEKYQTEAEAMIIGMEEAGTNLYSSILSRELDSTDVLMPNAVTDFAAMTIFPDLNLGCSSISSWNSATEEDPNLSGEIVFTRFMDWTPHITLLENHLLIVNFPSEEDEQNWMSFFFPGIIGVLSGINEHDVTAFMNVGNNDTVTNEADLHPIFLTMRNGLEVADYDESGADDNYDIMNAVADKNHLTGSIIHSICESGGIIAECNNASRTSVRTDENNTIIPVDHLVASNHFRTLYDPVYCYRYQGISDSLSSNPNMSAQRSWNVLSSAAGLVHNIHAIQFIPSMNQVRWATASPGMPAYLSPQTVFDVNELFSYNTQSYNEQVEEQVQVINAFPNPFKSSTVISFLPTADSTESAELIIYNIKGQKVKTFTNFQINNSSNQQVFWDGKDAAGKSVSSGIYMCKLNSVSGIKTKKIVLLK